MISYKPLFHTLIEKDAKKTDLIYKAGINSRVVAKFERNEHVNTSTLEKICLFLNCRIQEVIEILPDAEPEGKEK